MMNILVSQFALRHNSINEICQNVMELLHLSVESVEYPFLNNFGTTGKIVFKINSCLYINTCMCHYVSL